MRLSPWIQELALDIEVAVREYLERHPRTRSSEIRRAMRIAGRRIGAYGLGSRSRSAPRDADGARASGQGDTNGPAGG